MASVSFHHGTRVFESAETPLLVRIGRTAVIGLIGTAPDADALAFPLNKPVQILRAQDANALGNDGTLKSAIDSIFDQVGCPIVVVRVEAGLTTAATWAALIGDQTAFTGVHAFRRASSDGLYKPKLLIAPGFTQTSAADGIASINVTVGGSGYDADTTTVAITGTGSGAEAEAIVVEGAITGIIVRKAGYGYTGTPTVTITGKTGAKDAAATANIGSVLNPVVAELAGVAEKLKAVAYVDGPDTTDQAAVQYRGLINSGRIAICDPKVLKFDTTLEAVSYTHLRALQLDRRRWISIRASGGLVRTLPSPVLSVSIDLSNMAISRTTSMKTGSTRLLISTIPASACGVFGPVPQNCSGNSFQFAVRLMRSMKRWKRLISILSTSLSR